MIQFLFKQASCTLLRPGQHQTNFPTRRTLNFMRCVSGKARKARVSTAAYGPENKKKSPISFLGDLCKLSSIELFHVRADDVFCALGAKNMSSRDANARSVGPDYRRLGKGKMRSRLTCRRLCLPSSAMIWDSCNTVSGGFVGGTYTAASLYNRERRCHSLHLAVCANQ